MIPDYLIQRAVEQALQEDLQGGDVTTCAVVPEALQARAHAVAKQPLVACGSHVFARVFYTVDPALRVEELIGDGGRVEPGAVLYRVEGPARGILTAERTALNFIQRMAGVATLARRFVDQLPAGAKTRIVDTRKTTPGLRAFERYAVCTGGAYNHRDSLAAGIMIKDNHIIAAGGVAKAIQSARRAAPHPHRVEVEVESLAALAEALSADAEIVMLDNFAPSELPQALALIGGRALVEISGGLTLDQVAPLAELGVDIISVGALTHSATTVDISLDLEWLGS